MDYRQTLDFLYSQLPMYQRIGAAAYKTDLDNTIEICRVLGNPEKRLRSIHIAGTNGKGSVAHLLASVMQESGYKTGLYTSPHLTDFRERIRINGKMIPKNAVTSFIEKHTDMVDHIKPSFFEYTFGMAMEYFADQGVDIAVVETGMGGRLDSTNVINPILSVITNIGMDHTRFLGDTMEKIAGEKAGIIKRKVPVVIGETQKETEAVFRMKASDMKADIHFADQVFGAVEIKPAGGEMAEMVLDISRNGRPAYNSFHVPFTSGYQIKNTLTALATIEQIVNQGFEVDEKAIRNGFSRVVVNTGLAGRWQILRKAPLTICDTGHNRDGIKQVVAQINKLNFKKLHFVLGTVDDKEIDEMLSLLPAEAVYYFCKADIPRGLDPDALNKKAGVHGLMGRSYPSVRSAYGAALKNAGENDLVFIGGSTFVVAEVL